MDRVLLVERGKDPSKGKWGLPGGIVEVGETLHQAITREVKEETGILIKPQKLITVFDSIRRDQNGKSRYHYILFEYLCEYISGDISPDSDAPDAKWVPLDDLDSVDIMSSTKKFILKVLET